MARRSCIFVPNDVIMEEQEFIAAIERSMQNAAREARAMGREPQSAISEQAIAQEEMLLKAKDNWQKQ